MAYIPFPNGALAVLEYGLTSTTWTNTLWFEDLLGPPADFQALADYLENWANTNIMPNLASGVSFKKCTVYDASSQFGQVYISPGAGAAGGVSAPTAALNTACVLTFYSAYRGRSGRGRNYITGFSEDDISALNVEDPVIMTNMETAYNNLMAGVQTGPGFYWVVASKYANGVPRAEVLANQVLSVTVRTAKLGTQRRRIGRD